MDREQEDKADEERDEELREQGREWQTLWRRRKGEEERLTGWRGREGQWERGGEGRRGERWRESEEETERMRKGMELMMMDEEGDEEQLIWKEGWPQPGMEEKGKDGEETKGGHGVGGEEQGSDWDVEKKKPKKTKRRRWRREGMD